MVDAVGTILGAVTGELLKSIIEAKDTASNYKSLLKRLKSTLDSISPKIQQIQLLDEQLQTRNKSKSKSDPPPPEIRNESLTKLIHELQNGKILVSKCSKIQNWNVYQKYRYAKKIEKLDNYICRFFEIDIQAEILFDTKQLLVGVQESNRILNHVISGGSSSSSGYRKLGFGSAELHNNNNNNIVGMSVPLSELKMQLLRDDVTVLGLCAPGGCGKTTLASMLCQDPDIKGIFKDNIFFLTVSSSPNLRDTLQRLLELMDTTAYRLPDFQNDEEALNYLLKQIEKQPTLLVLDDVWSETFLRKLVFKTVKYKMLVTSRSTFRTFDTIHNLKMLNESDANTLFNAIALPEDNCQRPDEDLVNKIVRGCKGFPLVIKVIAESLCSQPPRIWKTIEKKLSEDGNIFDLDKDLLNRLAISLDLLEEDSVRECFLDLGCFPEDKRIPAAALIDIWVELYDFDNEDDAYVNILELSSRNLINLIESTRKDAGQIDGSFNELFVVQHDVLRDLAIHRSRGNQKISQCKRILIDCREDSLPKSWKDQQDQVFDACLVSVQAGETFSSEWCTLQFPLAEVLILNLSGKNCSLPQFMEKMRKLKVLIIANQGPHSALCGLPVLGTKFCHLKRIRLEKVLVPSLNEITEPFKNLKKISLVMCEFNNALKNCNINMSITFPNLIEIDIDYCNDLMELPQKMFMLTKLQKISITNCHNLFSISESIGQVTNLEVLRLHACTGLFELPNSLGTVSKLRFLDISDCSILERLPEGIGELCGLKKIDMRRCSRLRQLPQSVRHLRCLNEVICDEDMSIQWEAILIHNPNLKIKVPKENINLDWLGLDLDNINLFS